MLKHRNITLERFDKFIQTGQFSDVNLRSLLWGKAADAADSPAIQLKVFKVPDLKRISFEEAIHQKFVDAKVGDEFGPSWSTYWVHLFISIPQDWDKVPVTLIFDPACEALVWSKDGVPLQGITGSEGWDRHVDVPLTNSCKPGQNFEFYIEVACNGMFGCGDYLIGPPDPNRTFKLKKTEISVPNMDAHQLFWDFEIIHGMAKELPQDSQGFSDALYTANKIINTVRYDVPSSVSEALIISQDFFKRHKLINEEDFDHTIIATGHCHIDTAWLWPYDETKRKVARSWSTQCSLMDIYPDITFSCSQAAQFAWVEEYYPALFKRIQDKVKKRQFIPIGGTWVEMDCNLPSGEGFCRQFLFGQKHFESTFGEKCVVFWLPDTFGYSAQLPQIMKESGLKYFFTQKLSWNNINKFPHSTFYWTGLDGTSVLTHFSPADTYCAQVNVKEVVFSVKNNKDKEYSRHSLLLYGNGDGGGGPLIPMIERLKRLSNVSSLPANVKPGNPNHFFETLEKKSRDVVEWKGELYFELHRGTYTAQAKTKMFNRKCEYLLRLVELLAVYTELAHVESFNSIFSDLSVSHDSDSSIQHVHRYPKAEFDRLWKLVLLNQFHDVLPGSSIEMVYKDAEKYYEMVVEDANKLLGQVLLTMKNKNDVNHSLTVFNPTSWPVNNQVIEVDLDLVNDKSMFVQVNEATKKGLYLISNCAPFATSSLVKLDTTALASIAVKESSGLIVVENKYLIITLNTHGQIASLFDKSENRELIPENQVANKFKLFEDIPLFWDAWDVEVYHLEKGWDAGVGTASVEEQGPVRVVLRVQHDITPTSKLTQRIIISAKDRMIEFDTQVEWNENRKMLKVEFPVNINNDVATFESQYGYIQRPTHYNTSWDMARFEVCAHKYVDLSEYGYGVALFNDCKYGHSVHKNVMRTSLLRSPKAPDGNCDIGTHRFRYAMYPHIGTFMESEVVERAYQFNVPCILLPKGSASVNTPIIQVDKRNLILDCVKKPENLQDNVIVARFYESLGGRGVARIQTFKPFKRVIQLNVLEEDKTKDDATAIKNLAQDGLFVEVEFNPFQLLTLKFEF